MKETIVAETVYTYEAGRAIWKNGKPFLTVNGCAVGSENYDPTEFDHFARLFAQKVFNCDYGLPSNARPPIHATEEALQGWQEEAETHAWRLTGTNWVIRWYSDADGYWLDREGSSDPRLPRSFSTLNAAKRCAAQLRAKR